MAAEAHAYLGTTEQRAAALMKEGKTKTKQKQHKRNARERHHDIRSEDIISLRHLWLINDGERTSTNPLALGYPLIGRSSHVRAYYSACRSRALAFSAAIHFAMKRSAPCSAPPCAIPPRVLGSNRPLVGVDAKSSEVVRETPHPVFFLARHAAHAAHQFYEHHALR